MIRVGVCGAEGRMGSEACRAIRNDAGTELVAAIGSSSRVSELADAGVEVVVDFTVAAATRANMPAVAAFGAHAVVGTSGLDVSDIDSLRNAFTASHCLIAPNFAIGAVLMMRFAELAAPYFDTAEVVEFHHNRKVDAPSGTAVQTVRAMSEASPDWSPDPTVDLRLPGARGAQGPGGIPIHAVRLKGVVARQDVNFGGTGEMLTIRHDTIDRSAFMPGVLMAVKQLVELPPGLTVGLDRIMGF